MWTSVAVGVTEQNFCHFWNWSLHSAPFFHLCLPHTQTARYPNANCITLYLKMLVVLWWTYTGLLCDHRSSWTQEGKGRPNHSSFSSDQDERRTHSETFFTKIKLPTLMDWWIVHWPLSLFVPDSKDAVTSSPVQIPLPLSVWRSFGNVCVIGDIGVIWKSAIQIIFPSPPQFI